MSEESVLDGREDPSHETPQAITITIMDPTALETTTLDSTLVTSVQSEDAAQGMSTLLVVPREGHGSVNIKHGAKDILQTVTEKHMGTEELPVISSISNTEEECEGTIQVTAKATHNVEESEAMGATPGDVPEEEEGEVEGEGEEADDSGEPMGQHCLICNMEMSAPETEKPIPFFKAQTSTTQRKMSVFLGTLVGQKLTSRKAHSDIMCSRCFNLLDRVDALEVEIRDTREEIITKYQDTVTVYGGRARRRKPAIAKKSDYVFPKVEPEEELIGLEIDKNFEPRMEDLMEEEQDHREDRSIQDEEWEPEFKRPKIKREAADPDPNGPPKRKRGRPRKDASKPKAKPEGGEVIEVSKLSPRRKRRGEGKGTSLCLNLYSSEESRQVENSHANTLSSTFSKDSIQANESHQRQAALGDIAESLSVLETSKDLQNTKVYYCPVCNRPFRNRSNMNKHIKLHNNNRPFVCDKCGNSYRQKHALKDHLQTHEVEKKLFACKYCCLKFTGRQKWVTHENRHKGLCACICEVCGVRYENKYALEDHMSKHTGQYKYSCSECKKGFNKIEALKDHSNVHTGNRPYSCEICKKSFANCGTFWQHKMTHKTEREFICSVCEKSFKLKTHLTKHMKIHGSERKHVCDVCGQAFLKMYHLQRHKRLHTGEKPYICERCGQGFLRGDKLKEHLQKHHRSSNTTLNQRPSCQSVTSKVGSVMAKQGIVVGSSHESTIFLPASSSTNSQI